MIDANTPIGLYSIGVRNLTMPELVTWAANARIPFVHLRGGARGHAVLDRPRAVLEHWRESTRSTCPITLVTSDVTLSELTATDAHARALVLGRLELTYEAAAVLGAHTVRILADSPPDSIKYSLRPPDARFRLLIELHHASWWTTTGLRAARTLTDGAQNIRLLADSAQAAAGLAPYEAREARQLAARMMALSDVVHLSDNGSGLGAHGHALLAEAARAAESNLEVGFEWTGEPRTVDACLQRYHDACTWWRGLRATHRKDAE